MPGRDPGHDLRHLARGAGRPRRSVGMTDRRPLRPRTDTPPAHAEAAPRGTSSGTTSRWSSRCSSAWSRSAPLEDLVWPRLNDRHGRQVLVMATNMAIGMGAWMRFRRHSWLAIAEMSAAMYLPFLVLLVPFWAGAISGTPS